MLEATNFQWTIVDVLAQPEPEMKAVFYLKNIGETIRKHDEKEKNPDVEEI